MTLTLIEPRRERRQPDSAITPKFDRFGRRIDYLRISLTDRCNLRCVYCMPATGMRFAPRDELLSDEEFLRLIRLATELGFRKFRLTGAGRPYAGWATRSRRERALSQASVAGGRLTAG